MGREKCKGLVSLCLCRSEDGPAIPVHGGKGFEEIKSTLFLLGRKINTLLLARTCGSFPSDIFFLMTKAYQYRRIEL